MAELLLEWLAELGPVGLLAILAGGFALWKLIRELWPLRPELAVAVAVVPVHNLVDFSVHGTGVALPWAVLVGWAVASRGEIPEPESGPPGRPMAAALAAFAVAATFLHATSAMVVNTAPFRAEPEERFTDAVDARRLAPWRADSLDAIAIAALESGDSRLIEEASAILEESRWLRPHSASLADLRSRLAQALGHAPSALVEAWTAQESNPWDPAYRQRVVRLFSQLQDDGVVEKR